MTLDLDRDPAAPPAARPGTRGPTLRLAVVSAILAAVLASGGTAALLLATAPAAAPAATASPTHAPAAATLTRVDAGDGVASVAAVIEPSVVTISGSGGGRLASSGGSGIIVSADGLILTTTVVAPGDASYTILLSDQTQATARVVASDPASGLVLLRADRTGLTPARLAASASLVVGQVVVAVGSPLGEFTDTVTAGIVSGLGRSIDLRDPSTGRRVALQGLVQTDAAINPGSSGGPLLDVGGTVVAVIATSASGGQGIGFAIPIDGAAALIGRAGS
jgi:putative serine protease PepD